MFPSRTARLDPLPNVARRPSSASAPEAHQEASRQPAAASSEPSKRWPYSGREHRESKDGKRTLTLPAGQHTDAVIEPGQLRNLKRSREASG
jgi:hypothetical protein